MKLDGEAHAARGPGWEERRDHRAEDRVRWTARSAQWAALGLARDLFGPSATVRWVGSGTPPATPFGGMLQLRVPFGSLEDHRGRESRFLTLTRIDPVLASFPFLYVFEPDPETPPPPTALVSPSDPQPEGRPPKVDGSPGAGGGPRMSVPAPRGGA